MRKLPEEVYWVYQEIRIYEHEDEGYSVLWRLCKFYCRCRGLRFYRFLEREVSHYSLKEECLDWCDEVFGVE